MDWISHFRPIFIGATRRKLCFQLLALHKFPVANRTTSFHWSKRIMDSLLQQSWALKSCFLLTQTKSSVFELLMSHVCTSNSGNISNMTRWGNMRAPLLVQPSHVWHIRDTSDASVYNLYTDSFTDRPILWYDTLQRAPEKVFTGEAFIESNWRMAEWPITG